MLPKEYLLTASEKNVLSMKSAMLSGVFGALPYIPDGIAHAAVKKLLGIQGTQLQQRFLAKLAVTFKHALRDLNPQCRKKIAQNLFGNVSLRGQQQRQRITQALGFEIPLFLVISPTMKCPLRCYGCYSAQYAQDADLDYTVFDALITEAKSLGMYFFVISGGEPFVYPRIYELLEKHSDAWFQIYTSGVTLNKENTRRLAQMGNVNPCISVEGFEIETDRRRGKGHFKKVMSAFENLRQYKIPFGFSATATRENNDLIVSESFVNFYYQLGAKVGWFFQYMPIGREPNLDLVPTPRQRINRFYRMIDLREKYDMLLADFWNDGWLTEGCLAGARRYLHINHSGDIEPCVFCQIAVDNIYKKGLLEALKTSPLFKAIRDRQPYNKNMLRPCMIIDNPEVLRDVINEVDPKETCVGGARRLISELYPAIKKTADEFGVLADEAWKNIHEKRDTTIEEAKKAAEEALKKQ